MTTLADRLEALAGKATPGQWMGYSEPEVNLPYGLFRHYDRWRIDQLEPLCPADIDLIVALRESLPTILSALRSVPELVEALKTADDAIREMFRYYDGGEMRGSYDGKPERNQLRKAGYITRAALTKATATGGGE